MRGRYGTIGIERSEEDLERYWESEITNNVDGGVDWR